MRVNRRSRALVAALVGAGVPLFAACSPGRVDNGEVPDPISTGETVLFFVVLPLAIAGVIALLALLPGWLRAPRYRPTRSWEHEPLWFGGPQGADDAMDRATGIVVRGGGASAGW